MIGSYEGKIRDTVTGGSVLASGAQPPASVTNFCSIQSGTPIIVQYTFLNKQFLVRSLFYVCRLLCLKLLRTGSEDPRRHEREFLFYYLII